MVNDFRKTDSTVSGKEVALKLTTDFKREIGDGGDVKAICDKHLKIAIINDNTQLATAIFKHESFKSLNETDQKNIIINARTFAETQDSKEVNNIIKHNQSNIFGMAENWKINDAVKSNLKTADISGGYIVR